MSLQVPTKDIATFHPPATRRSLAVPIVLTLIVVLLGGAGWYYFFGRKPKVAMSVALEANGNAGTRGLWSAGPGEMLFATDGEVLHG